MKVKSKKNNLKRVFSILTVVFILSILFIIPCSAWSVSEFNGITGTGYNSQVLGYLTYENGDVYAVFTEYRIPSGSSFTYEYHYFTDITVLFDYYTSYSSHSTDDFYSRLTLYGQSWYSNILKTEITNQLSTFDNIYSLGYNDGLIVGATAGKNQVMDEIVQNANSNGTNIPNQSYSSQALINVLNEIRNSSEYDGAFNQEDSDIRYLVNELIRLGVLAEPYDTFELTVDGNLENAKRIWYLEGLEESEEGINDRLQQAYNTGYTDGGKDADFMNDTLITIFSSPYYILNEVFNFEIFGVSVAGILTFLLSIMLVGWVIRIIL